MKAVLIITFLLAYNLTAFAQVPRYDPSGLSEDGRKAYKKILKAVIFRIGGVGYSGHTSEEEIALHHLLDDPDSVNALVYLSEHATPEGSLFALLGLRFKIKEVYEKQIPRVNSLPDPPERESVEPFRGLTIPAGQVLMQSGCIVDRMKRTVVLALIESGRYDPDFAK
ncbi:MAG TPA: hypothetical protein VFD58_00415 [Blastocatellia bacterium]|nr:hypothetical protein [Blastocatellia bacterium]